MWVKKGGRNLVQTDRVVKRVAPKITCHKTHASQIVIPQHMWVILPWPWLSVAGNRGVEGHDSPWHDSPWHGLATIVVLHAGVYSKKHIVLTMLGPGQGQG